MNVSCDRKPCLIFTVRNLTEEIFLVIALTCTLAVSVLYV